MFTGLVEGTARVAQWRDGQQGGKRLLLEEFPFSLREVSLGESIAINGCCLTVADFLGEALAFDLLEETLQVTALDTLQQGMEVNVERALALGERLGGHMVQGHVDGTVQLVGFQELESGDWKLTVQLDKQDLGKVLPRGSITLDGISLTAAELDDQSAQLSCFLIPHTLEITNLKQFLHAEPILERAINVEFDLLGKFVSRQSLFSSSA